MPLSLLVRRIILLLLHVNKIIVFDYMHVICHQYCDYLPDDQ